MSPIPMFIKGSILKKLAPKWMLVTMMILCSCKMRNESPTELKYRAWSGAVTSDKLGLKFLYADTFKVCFDFVGNTTMTPTARHTMAGTVLKSIEKWVAGLGDLYTGGINVKFIETCNSTAHFQVHVDDNVAGAGDPGREYAYPGEIFLKPSTSAATILHEVGHAFAGLDDLYIEAGGGAGNCQPFQPNSVMCGHKDARLIDITDDDRQGIQETYRIVYKDFWSLEAATNRAQSAVDLANSDLTDCKIVIDTGGVKPLALSEFQVDLKATPTQGGSAQQYTTPQLDHRMSVGQMRDKILIFLPNDTKCRSKIPQYPMYQNVLSKLTASQNKCLLTMAKPIILPSSEDMGDFEAHVQVNLPGETLSLRFNVNWFDGETPEQIEQRTIWSLSRPEIWQQWQITQPDCFPGRDKTAVGLTSLKAGDTLTLDLKNSRGMTRYISLKAGESLSYVISPAPAPIRGYIYDVMLASREERTVVGSRFRPEITGSIPEDTQRIVGPIEGIFLATPYRQSATPDIRTIEFGTFDPVVGVPTVMSDTFGNFQTFGGSAGDHVFLPTSALIVLDGASKISIEVAKAGPPLDNLRVRLYGPLKKGAPLPLTRVNGPEMPLQDGSRFESQATLQPGSYQIEFFLEVPATAPPGPSFLPFRMRVKRI